MACLDGVSGCLVWVLFNALRHEMFLFTSVGSSKQIILLMRITIYFFLICDIFKQIKSEVVYALHVKRSSDNEGQHMVSES